MQQKTSFALSDFVLLLVCHIGMLVLNENAKEPFVPICFGIREKIASLTGLNIVRLRKVTSAVLHTTFLIPFLFLGCQRGTWGQNCRSKCGNCLGNSPCHHINGTCLEGCETGWLGFHCVAGKI